jgi:hypothetical protein
VPGDGVGAPAPGRPRPRAGTLLADKGDDSQAFRQQRRRGVQPTVPAFARRPRRGPRRWPPLRVGPSDRHPCRRLVVRDERELEHDKGF